MSFGQCHFIYIRYPSHSGDLSPGADSAGDNTGISVSSIGTLGRLTPWVYLLSTIAFDGFVISSLFLKLVGCCLTIREQHSPRAGNWNPRAIHRTRQWFPKSRRTLSGIPHPTRPQVVFSKKDTVIHLNLAVGLTAFDCVIQSGPSGLCA